MTEHSKVVANRRNAGRSTGPRSAAGKARASQNALKHGLTAKQVVLFDEDFAQFEALRNSLSAYYQPEGPVAEYLVKHLAACIWRLKRVPEIEAGIYSCFRLWIEGEEDQARLKEKSEDIPYGREKAHIAVEKERQRRDKLLHGYQPALGRAFLRGQESVERLIRIASAIEGSMYRAIRELERMKAERSEAVEGKFFVVDSEEQEEEELWNFE